MVDRRLSADKRGPSAAARVQRRSGSARLRTDTEGGGCIALWVSVPHAGDSQHGTQSGIARMGHSAFSLLPRGQGKVTGGQDWLAEVTDLDRRR